MAVVLGSAIVFLDSTVVNVALPAMGQQLPVSLFGVLEAQSYVVNGYLLALSALLILAGALADVYGRRRLFIIGLIGFGISSVLCGLSTSMEMLIVFRLVQGAFGALLVPASLAIITATFEGADRGRAFGIWAAASSATTVLGPPLGGLLVDSIGWPVAFLINVPLVAIALYFAATAVSESRDEDASGRFDWAGALVVAVAVGGLTYGAIRGQEQQWVDRSAWIALALGAVATVALVPLMVWRRHPLVPPSLFTSRNFTITNISTFLIYGALYVFAYIQGIFMQGTLGYTAMAAGLAGIPIGVLIATLSTTVGRLAGRVGPRLFMAVGPTLMALGLLWLVRIPGDSAAWRADPGDPASLLPPISYLVDVFPAVLIFGVGIAMLVAPLTTALMSSVPVRNSGLASAINNAISRVGPLLAGAVIFVAVTASFYGSLQARLPELDTDAPAVRAEVAPLNRPSEELSADEAQAARAASTDAFHLAMLIAALLCAAGAAVNALGIRNPDLSQVDAAREQVATPA